MESFGQQARVAVIGASGGIGAAVTEHLANDDHVAELFAFTRNGEPPRHDNITTGRLDAEDEASIEAAAAGIEGELDLVFVALGLLHDGDRLQPEKDWRALDSERLARSFAVNAIGPALIAKHFLPKLPRQRRGAFAALSARVGSISDNSLGGWYGYRASKAALNQLLKTLSIELARKRPEAIVIGLQPGTVDTALSAPFQSFVPESKLFTPAFAAAKLIEVIDQTPASETGLLKDWSGAIIPF